MKKSLIVSICILFITACGSQSALIKPETVITADKGVILASVTKSKDTAEDATFFYRKEGEDALNSMQALGLVWSKIPDDFPQDESIQGRLLAFQVEPGKYFLDSWQYSLSVYPVERYVQSKNTVPFGFTVKPGEITYIGNLHIDTIFGKNLIGLTLPASGIPSIKDRKEFDLRILEEKYPSLVNLPVESHIADTKIWLNIESQD